MNATATSLSAAPSMSRRTLVLGAGAAAAAGILALDAAPAVAQGAEVPQTTATGSFVGKKGNVDVRIVMEGDRLADIIVSSHETPGLGTAALEQLRDLILAGQTLNVDSISGATLSSFALVNAVGEALDGAGFSAAEWEGRAKAERVRTQELPAEVDVLVVGSGAAGMCAAIEAAEAGATVAVFEKLGVPGGNSIISGAGYAAPGTWAQRQQGVEDSPEVMAQDMLAGGDYEGDPELVKVVCEGAAPAIEWLVYKNHVEWGASNMYEGGHTVAREGGPNGRGEAIMTKLFARAEQLGVALATDVKVDELVRDDSGKVCGVRATDLLTGDEVEVGATAVVLAAGGFGYNLEMRTKYNPAYGEAYRCTNCVGATGDGIAMAEAAGAQLADMAFIQVHPTCSPVDGEMLSTGSIRGGGHAVLVNKEGKRFVEELERRDVVSQAIIDQTDSLGYFAFNMSDGYSRFNAPITLRNAGMVVEADSLDEACAHFGIDADGLRETLAQWNADAEAGLDSQFNYRAEMFPIAEEGPWCIFGLVPSVHYTMGGVVITPKAEVTDADGGVIEGLFAAGEMCGNIMGTNRLGCTSYPNAVVFGRVAGTSAAAFAGKGVQA